MRQFSRADDTVFGRWWLSVDRALLASLAPIIFIGIIVLTAAGPTAAARLNIANDFHFPLRQVVFLAPALLTILAVSFMSPLQARRLGVVVFAAAMALMLATLMFSASVNGAARWIDFGFISVQPSEFAKPGFVVAAAWMLAEGVRDPRFPGGAVAMTLYLAFALLLLLQPDFGQWALVTAVWAVMFFIAGWSWLWMAVLAAAGAAALTAGYYMSAHVASRIDGFFNPGAADTYQMDRAIDTIANGGLIGRGDSPAVKGALPDAHTDFIFAAATEEHGLAIGIIIIALFAIFVVRAFVIAASRRGVFAQCAVAGLAAMIGLQAIINIGVSLRALPAKGMTLPFISYGGSSLLATGLAVGFIIALTRKEQSARRRKEIMP